jgi:hypothetical protein
MQKFIIKTLVFAIVMLILLVSVNYWGDAAKIFHTGYEKNIAKIIFTNKNVTNISNYDERILQKELINKIKSNPDVSIIGSSRTMLINSSYFENKKVINNSVSGASIEDFIAIYQMYKAKNILPHKIILGIDPWLFNENSGQTRWLSLKKEYYNFSANTTDIEKDILNEKIQQLFSFSYFQSSLKELPAVILGKSNPIPSNKIYNKSNTKIIDGSFTYSLKYRNLDIKDVGNKAKNYIVGKIYSIGNFDTISPKIFNEFDKLCKEIQETNIELCLFLAPYHPIVYAKLKKDYGIVLDVENKITEYAKQNKIKIFGSFNPVKIGIDNTGFYDGMHSKEKTIRAILKVRTHNNTYKSLGKW